jgi:hypothetical protein
LGALIPWRGELSAPVAVVAKRGAALQPFTLQIFQNAFMRCRMQGGSPLRRAMLFKQAGFATWFKIE